MKTCSASKQCQQLWGSASSTGHRAVAYHLLYRLATGKRQQIQFHESGAVSPETIVTHHHPRQRDHVVQLLDLFLCVWLGGWTIGWPTVEFTPVSPATAASRPI